VQIVLGWRKTNYIELHRKPARAKAFDLNSHAKKALAYKYNSKKFK